MRLRRTLAIVGALVITVPVSAAVDCTKYENHVGTEPPGFAENCLGVRVAPAEFTRSRGPQSPTSTAFAQDIGFISDNFVSHLLNDFPGQTVVGSSTNAIFGMDFDPSATTLYALDNNLMQLGVIDLGSGGFTPIGPIDPIPGHTITGLTIHPLSGVFYASSTDGLDSMLYTLDPASGTMTQIGPVGTPLLIDISIGPNGDMYGHEISDDSIYSIDPVTGAGTLVGPTGFAANFAQGMDFDNEHGTLYIYIYLGGGANVYGTVDLATGAVTPLAQDNPLGEFEGATQTTAQGRLYGAAHSGAQNAPSTLFRVNSTTGAAIPVGPIGFNHVGALDFDPGSGMLYGSGQRGDGTLVLISIDPVTAVGTEIGPHLTTFDHTWDLSVRNADSTLYLTSFGAPCVSLYTADTTTGEASLVGDTTSCAPGNALGFALDDTLYHANANGSLNVLDQDTGLATPIAPLSFVGFPTLANPRVTAMEVDPVSGIAYVAINDGALGSGPNYLATIDLATGVITHVGQTENGLVALALVFADLIFADSFESGDTSAWSSEVP